MNMKSPFFCEGAVEIIGITFFLLGNRFIKFLGTVKIPLKCNLV